MEPTEYVKISYSGQMNYVKITKHEETLQYQDFLLSASMYADISCLDIDYFTDSQNVRIFEGQFMDIFDRFKNHPEFYLKIVMKNNKSEENETQTLSRQNCRLGHDMFISAQDLEDYIIKNKNAFLLCKKYKENERSKPLSDMERRAIVRDCVDFLTEKYSHHPDSNQLNALALSVVKLFPQLKTSNAQTGGIDALYDRKNNRGFLISRLNRVRQKLLFHTIPKINVYVIDFSPGNESLRQRTKVSGKRAITVE